MKIKNRVGFFVSIKLSPEAWESFPSLNSRGIGAKICSSYVLVVGREEPQGMKSACRAAVRSERSSRCQTACKPGSVCRRFREAGGSMAIHLGRSLPNASRDLPGRRRGKSPGLRRACRPYLVLLRVGFAVPPPLPDARCALTAPFHPCRAGEPVVRGPGGLLSVALSLGFPPPGVTRHPFPVEPGLSSPTSV